MKASFTNSYTDSVEQMKDNRMHAFALGTGIPASSLMDLASAREIKLMDMAEIYEPMQKINPAYKLVTIPKGTYPKQDKDVQVIGYYTHVIAACSLPEDTVYKMTAIFVPSKDQMSADLQGVDQAHAADHGPGYRRAVPPWRCQVVQGTGHHSEVGCTKTAECTEAAREPSEAISATGRDHIDELSRSGAIFAQLALAVALAMALYHIYVIIPPMDFISPSLREVFRGPPTDTSSAPSICCSRWS